MPLNEAARNFLDEKRFAVLATIDEDGVPQQTVMWYELRGDTIAMNTKAGRAKDRFLRRDPRASICVEDGERYVTIAGRITMIEDESVAQEDIRRLAIRYDGAEEGNRQAREIFSKQQRITLHLSMDKLITRGLGE
jgi:PPOX class probable F420-dependent enzyme